MIKTILAIIGGVSVGSGLVTLLAIWIDSGRDK